MNKRILFAIVLILGCTTTTTTQPAPAPAPAQKPPGFKNLQVFAKDIPRDDLIKAMRGFTRGLGVRCNFCHAVTATEPREQLDFPADTKEEKRIARVMLQMTMQINSAHLPRVAEVKHETEFDRVSCWTCHRGHEEPELPPPPPPEPERPPQH